LASYPRPALCQKNPLPIPVALYCGAGDADPVALYCGAGDAGHLL